ncbi:class V chitinase CHIT5a-like [Coffea arabica]|uniref:Class V chitinase CHIT5a-like n=1 Tax=Coffea arabica TaxID=13443 RepID=A0ABM4UYZ9_COFAR
MAEQRFLSILLAFMVFNIPIFPLTSGYYEVSASPSLPPSEPPVSPPYGILPPSPSPSSTSLPPRPASQPPVPPKAEPPSPCSTTPSLAPSPSPLPSSGIKGAYWPSWQAEIIPPSSIPTSYFTHFFYAFALIDPTSCYLNISSFDEKWMTNFTTTLHQKSPSVKVLLSIGGAAANATIFSYMASNFDNRASFIISSLNEARRHGFDGLDLDWEYPATQQDMSNLALLFREWRVAARLESLLSGKPRLLISAAVYFSSNVFNSGVYRTYPGYAIREYLDFLNPMCYDYRGFWNTSVTGAQALLYDNSSNISTSYGISSWKASGVPSEKLVLGLPAYGRSWTLKDGNQNGIGAPAVGVGPGDQGMIGYNEIAEFNLKNNATVVYDGETVSTYSYAGTTWIGYDDATSIINKIKFAKSQGLGGYFFWALGSDVNWSLSRAASMAWDGEI